MNDIKLYKFNEGETIEMQRTPMGLERILQNKIEANLKQLFGVCFLKSEYVIPSMQAAIGEDSKGRIDSLGIDQSGCPVIIEYKLKSKDTVVNQGLGYLAWLLDHKAEFKLLVQDKASNLMERIDWTSPRLLCIAEDFNKYDVSMLSLIRADISLIRYRWFQNDDLLMLEYVAGSSAIPLGNSSEPDSEEVTNRLAINPSLQPILDDITQSMFALGDDVELRERAVYKAFTAIRDFKKRNFACVVFRSDHIILTLHVNPDEVDLEENFTRKLGKNHHGTGDLEVRIHSLADLEKAKPLIQRAYDGGVNES